MQTRNAQKKLEDLMQYFSAIFQKITLSESTLLYKDNENDPVY